MSKPYFIFANKKSNDMGLIMQSGHSMGAPDRDADFVSVPGRNGDLIQDNGRFNNYTDEYDCALYPNTGTNVEAQAKKIKNWLQGSFSYQRLIDYNELDYYRMAVCTSKIDIQKTLARIGWAKIIFNCKPFRYRLDGDTVQTITATKTITNPEVWASLPYMKVYGTGDITLHINDQDVVLTGISDYIEIDSELQSCFKDLVLQNSHYRSDFWPQLDPGPVQISWTGTVSKIEITPRWCCL